MATTVGTKEEKTLFYSNVTTDAPPPPASPVGTTAKGTCAVTFQGAACSDALSGSYNTTTLGISTLAECVNAVSGCSNGNYVSFSLKNEDCSW